MKSLFLLASALIVSTPAIAEEAPVSEVTGETSILGIDTSNDFDLKFEFDNAGDSSPTDPHQFAGDKDSDPADLHEFADDKTATSIDLKADAKVDAGTEVKTEEKAPEEPAKADAAQ